MKIFQLFVLFFVINTINAFSQDTEIFSLKKPLNFYDCIECVQSNPDIDFTTISKALSEVVESDQTLHIVIDFKVSSENQIESGVFNTNLMGNSSISESIIERIQNALTGLNLYKNSINIPTKTTLFLEVQNNQVTLNPVIH